MELKLENGKYSAVSRGGLERVSGTEEMRQRVEMKLTAHRGGFALMPEFGSRLYLLPSVKPSQRAAAAEQFITEALSDESGLSLQNLTLTDNGDGCIALDVTLKKSGSSAFGVSVLI